MEIADKVERWSTMPKDDVAVAMLMDTPVGAMLYIVSGIPLGERAAVEAALPTITTNDFAEAARQIRRVAEGLR